eukprot:CAMPEP_0174338386 /NCGR_PEP_ID=MMETSP0810-20121108/23088_1 /TAXON_ID=73025 ORGANISM="Eutreptiella gymnastica-like, Strain CCMP1594" /NCGR_SAMPLE_ID=MMETSP0810 /ASSEMBLY_ACC=CAM_ASM_000659 /LENGTH=32 /DNA_ID= /DNA_START= /DNA_END= /DNA_ORIENTATION=
MTWRCEAGSSCSESTAPEEANPLAMNGMAHRL